MIKHHFVFLKKISHPVKTTNYSQVVCPVRFWFRVKTDNNPLHVLIYMCMIQEVSERKFKVEGCHFSMQIEPADIVEGIPLIHEHKVNIAWQAGK